MPSPEDVQAWTTDAREHGLPVMVTGVLLLVAVLGIPLWAAGLIVGIPMIAGLVCLAQVAFPVPDPGD